MEPVSALPGCVLQMTLKSSCSQTAFPRLSLRGNSEEWDCRGSAPAVCLSAEKRGRDEGRKKEGEKEGWDRGESRVCGLSLTFHSLLPNSTVCFTSLSISLTP